MRVLAVRLGEEGKKRCLSVLAYYKFNSGPIHSPVVALKMWSGGGSDTFLVINALDGPSSRLAPFAIKNLKIK